MASGSSLITKDICDVAHQNVKGKRFGKPRIAEKDATCYICGVKGHKSPNCPDNTNPKMGKRTNKSPGKGKAKGKKQRGDKQSPKAAIIEEAWTIGEIPNPENPIGEIHLTSSQVNQMRVLLPPGLLDSSSAPETLTRSALPTYSLLAPWAKKHAGEHECFCRRHTCYWHHPGDMFDPREYESEKIFTPKATDDDHRPDKPDDVQPTDNGTNGQTPDGNTPKESMDHFKKMLDNIGTQSSLDEFLDNFNKKWLVGKYERSPTLTGQDEIDFPDVHDNDGWNSVESLPTIVIAAPSAMNSVQNYSRPTKSNKFDAFRN